MKLIVVMFTLLLTSSFVEAKPARLELAGINGKEYSLADYRGKWVVVNYWATWCSPCLEEIPELNKLHKKRDKLNLQLLGVNFEDAPDSQVLEFSKQLNIAYPVLLEEMDVFSQLGIIEGLPKTFIISPSGEIVYEKVGIVNAAFIEEVLAKLKSGKQ